MQRLLIIGILAIEIFALLNHGGGPLLSHLFLTGVVSLLLCIAIFRKPKINFSFDAAAIFYILFLVVFLASFAFSLTSQFGLAELFLYINGGIIFLMVRGADFSEKEKYFLGLGLLALAVADTVFGVFLYTGAEFLRFVGTFIDTSKPYTATANDYANFLLLLLPVAFAWYFKKHERRSTALLLGITCALLLSGFLLSFSRAAWLSLAGIGIIALILRLKSLHIRFVAKAGAVLLITALLTSVLQTVRSENFETNSLVKKLLFQAGDGGASASERWAYWSGAIALIRERPIFGGGVQSFQFLFPQHQEVFGITSEYPHNIFFKIGVESGIFAMAFFIFFLLSIGILAVRHVWKFRRDLPFALGALASITHHLLDYNFKVSNFVLFMVFLGLCAPAKISEPSNRSRVFMYSTVGFVSLFLLLLGIHEGYYNISFKKGREAFAQGNFRTSIELLEKARTLYFERDLPHYLAEGYEEQFKSTGDPQWREKEKVLLVHSMEQGIDAGFAARLAKIFEKEKNFAEAENLYRRALALDPWNNLEYYYGVLAAQALQGKAFDPAVVERSNALIQEYQEILRKNQHLTILTKNPEYAVKLASLLGKNADAQGLKKLWIQEYIKYSLKFGAQAAPAPAL